MDPGRLETATLTLAGTRFSYYLIGDPKIMTVFKGTNQ